MPCPTPGRSLVPPILPLVSPTLGTPDLTTPLPRGALPDHSPGRSLVPPILSLVSPTLGTPDLTTPLPRGALPYHTLGGAPMHHDPAARLRRAPTATRILDLAAWVGLLAGLLWWMHFFWLMITPSMLTELVLTAAFALAYAVVLPMLISMLFPGTPAGMLLAETRWRTFGHAIALGAAVFMVYHGFVAVWAWWQTRPVTVAAGQDLPLAIGTLIVFVVVPALSWVQMAPDQWVAEIVQAQQVKRLRAAQQANLMAARIQYARAMHLLKRGLANTTAAERAELAGTLIAMQRAENEAISQVAAQMRLLTGIDTGTPLLDDDHLLDQYDRLTYAMEQLVTPVNAAYAEAPDAVAPPPAAPLTTPLTVPSETAAPAEPAARHEPPRPASSPPASSPPASSPPASSPAPSTATALAVAQRELSGAWSRAQLETVLSVQKTKATALIRTWRSEGHLIELSDPAFHYAWATPERSV
ncbi:hypothetical protein EYB53_019945 [Candidatus Chloroploca sp. M-50]|uniref:Uncharacterized protein n=1 Tax=Candidatus Chloroploca mongolica TaxID=2528176 RepID=A0ABS4DF05_9CHLR|nr:hypothetical protein [Candidatus Chloroploca mongolica]MBP1468000.1 hypothetical protein [Candidatus Chloroploca mongolica]